MTRLLAARARVALAAIGAGASVVDHIDVFGKCWPVGSLQAWSLQVMVSGSAPARGAGSIYRRAGGRIRAGVTGKIGLSSPPPNRCLAARTRVYASYAQGVYSLWGCPYPSNHPTDTIGLREEHGCASDGMMACCLVRNLGARTLVQNPW